MKDRKEKIYFLLSSESYLEPVSGDRINEMNLIRALCEFYDVYYNGVLVSQNDEAFGDHNRKINPPKEGEYDLIYIRNNKDVFIKSPSPKLWFASPYDKECFEVADGIVCMTKPWKEKLQKYDESLYDYFKGTYPRDMPKPKRCILFPQVISDYYFNNYKDEDVGPKRFKDKVKDLFISQDKKIIRHFGPIRESNYPYQMISAMSDKKIAKKVRAECIGAGTKVGLPKVITKVPRVSQSEVTYYLHNSDAIWYNQDESGNIAGSLKVLEAMAAGVPLLLPRYDARVDELGEDYPFFWELKCGSSITDELQPDFCEKLKKILSLSLEERVKLSYYLKDRAKRHSKKNVSNVINRELKEFWEAYNE